MKYLFIFYHCSLSVVCLPLLALFLFLLVRQQTQSICSLGEGNSFGEGVIVGNKRETMIVTSDECELLCVEAKHIRSIYEVRTAKTSVDFDTGVEMTSFCTC